MASNSQKTETNGVPAVDDINTSSGLFASGINALKWNYLGTTVRSASGLFVGILLARILGPEPIGQVAITSMVIGFAALISDFGLGSALVQRSSIDKGDIRFVYTLQVGLGGALTTIVFLLANRISQIFHSPATEPLLRAISVVFILQALGLTSASLLRRALRFRTLQISSVISYLVGYLGVGVPLAISGAGAWSLVVGQLLQTVLFTILVTLSAPHAIKPLLSLQRLGFISLGLTMTLSNLANWSTSNVDNLIVGRYFGAAALGLYSRAFTLFANPMQVAVTGLQGVLFPATARSQQDPTRVTAIYLGSLSLICLALLPAFLTLSTIPRTLILSILGPRWIEAESIMPPLALAMPLNALIAMSGPILWGLGRASAEFRAQALSAVISGLALVFATRLGLTALSWTVTAAYLVRWVLVARAANQALQTSWKEIGRTLLGPILVAVCCATIVKLFDVFTQSIGVEPTERLMGAAIVGMGVLSAAILTIPQMVLITESQQVIARITGNSPNQLIRIVGRRIAGGRS